MPKQQDPSKMTDEELDEALGLEPAIPEPEEPKPDEPKPPEEPATPAVEEPTPPEPVEPEEPEEPEEPVVTPPSRREQLRIQDLLAKMKETKPAAPAPKTPDALDYDATLNADPELIKKLTEDRDRATQTAWQQGIEKAKSIQFHTRLEIDAPRIEAKYPQLDKDSEDFHKGLAIAINNMYLSTVGYDSDTDTIRNPDIRYADYVESVFELAEEIAGPKAEASVKQIKKQVAKTGLRPDGNSAPKMDLNKPASQMTDEELDAVIALAVPKR